MSDQSARRLRLGHQHQVGSTHLRRGQLQEERAALHARTRRVCARKEDFRDSCRKRKECATARGSQSVSNSKAAAPPPFVQRCLVCQLTQTHPKAVKAVLAGWLVVWLVGCSFRGFGAKDTGRVLYSSFAQDYKVTLLAICFHPRKWSSSPLGRHE